MKNLAIFVQLQDIAWFNFGRKSMPFLLVSFAHVKGTNYLTETTISYFFSQRTTTTKTTRTTKRNYTKEKHPITLSCIYFSLNPCHLHYRIQLNTFIIDLTTYPLERFLWCRVIQNPHTDVKSPPSHDLIGSFSSNQALS